MLCGHVTANHIVLGCSDSSLQMLHKDGELIQRSRPIAETSHHLADVSKVYLSGDWLEDSLQCATKNGSVTLARDCVNGLVRVGFG